MAEEALKKVEDQLNCPICLDTLTDPKLLQCFHVYCRQCLTKLSKRDRQGKLGLPCPTCRQVTPIPDCGVSGLPSAFHISHLLDIIESIQIPVSKAEAIKPTVPKAMEVKLCSAHADKESGLYCETCGEMICWKCVSRGGQHCDHDYEELDQAFEMYKDEITSSLEPMEKQVTTMKEALAELDSCCKGISNQRAVTEGNIRVTFDRLQEILDIRKAELISQLDETTTSKLKALAAQRDQIDTSLAQLNGCLHYIRESIRSSSKGDVLMMKKNTVKKVKKLTTPFELNVLKPNTRADVIFTASADVAAACRNYGRILMEPGLPDPSKCCVTWKDAEAATVVGGKSVAILHTISFESKPCEMPIRSLECKFLSEITGTSVSCSVGRRGQSQYEISCQPSIKGRHQLHIRVEGHHIRGSPISLSVTSPVEKLGTPILSIDSVWTPCGVAINQQGNVVVTELGSHRVSVFSPNGDKLQSFGVYGSGQGEFGGPRGVAVDADGCTLVVDSWNHRIQKFTEEGLFLEAVGTEGNGALHFSHPSGIAVSPSNGLVYVVDKEEHSVHILNSDLTFSGTFGEYGYCRGQFREPWGVACDGTGKVYVADSRNHRVQVFTAEGKVLSVIGRRGQGRGELDCPIGVGIDVGSGMVYVSEAGNRRVSVFTLENKFVASFGKEGEGPGDFQFPIGLAVDNSGVVYVCDWDNHTIQLF